MSSQSLPDGLRIRDCVVRDGPVLEAMDAECFPPDIAFSRRELLSHAGQSDSVARIAEVCGEVVGFAIGRLGMGRCGHVITLDVAPGMRGRGIGRALMEEVHEEFRSRGMRFAVLEVEEGNAAAYHLYEGLGYELVELLKGYYAGRSNALRMQLDLGGG